MILLLNWRVWAALMLATVLAASHWKAYHSGAKSVQSEWDADTLQALEDDKKTLSERITNNAKIDKKYQAEKAQLQARAIDTDAALNGLRNALSAKDGNPATTCRIDAGGAERELFGQCATALVGLAKEADRVEGKLSSLQDYVIGVINPE